MDNNLWLLGLFAGSVLMFLVALILFKIMARKNVGEGSVREYQRLLSPAKGGTRQTVHHFLQQSYVFVAGIPIGRTYLANIRKRLSTLHTYDEWTMRKETMKIAFTAWMVLVFAALLLLLLSHDAISLFMTLIAVWVGHGMIVDAFVHRLEHRLLRELRHFLSDVRHHFHRHGMVEEAVDDAAESSPYEMALHAKAVYEVLSANNPEERLEQYYEVAPNRFLKGFAGISHLVKEYGDKLVQGGSMYVKALTRLSNEINLEILRRERLSYLLQGLTAISLMPILFTKPIENWARGHFPAMDDFYAGRLGFVTKIVILTIIFGSYLLLRKMQDHDEAKATVQRKPWERKLYEIPWIHWFVNRIVPVADTKEHVALSKLLKETNSPLRLEWFFVQRLVLCLLGFVLFLGVFVTMHAMEVRKVLTAPIQNATLFGQRTPQEEEKAKETAELDRRIIADVEGAKGRTYEAIVGELRKNPKLAQDEAQLATSAQRIVHKLDMLNGEYLKWWELLLSFLIGWLGYCAPVGVLSFQKRMRHMEMKHEVDLLHTVIAMLTEIDRMSVEQLLEWMERFAMLFKVPIQHSLLHYEHGAEKALEQLKEDAPFLPFVRTVEKLQLAVEKIPIRQAFDDLENEQSFYLEERKQEYERILEAKAGWGKMIGFAPMYALVFLYLVIPLVYVSLAQMSLYYDQIQKIS